MAFCIPMEKEIETDEYVIYRFGDTGRVTGRLRFDKATGDGELLEHAPGDENGHLWKRAYMKAIKHWQEGYFPDKTMWAS